jgi:hypothetical protein
MLANVAVTAIASALIAVGLRRSDRAAATVRCSIVQERCRRVSIQFSDFDLTYFADNKDLKIADVVVSGSYHRTPAAPDDLD